MVKNNDLWTTLRKLAIDTQYMSITKLDKNHRIVIDKQMRAKLGLKSGDSVLLLPSGKEIRLIPIKDDKSFVGSLDQFDYDPQDHKATELLLRGIKKNQTE